MKVLIESLMIVAWVCGLIMIVYGALSGNIACSISGSGLFIGIEISVKGEE